jgi:hypothetical protein
MSLRSEHGVYLKKIECDDENWMVLSQDHV